MTTRFKHPVAWATLACVSFLAGAAACRRPAADRIANQLKPGYDPETGKLSRLAYDANGDGTMDTWGFMDGTRVIRVESDEDQDGHIDRWEYHRDAEPGSDPLRTVERIERSTRHDGRISRREFFETGVLTRVEEDTDGDGAADKWELYTSGALSTMDLDSQRRGRPDRRFIYRPDGTLDRIEVDPSGSGKFEPLEP